MNEQEAVERARQNDRAFAAERERLAKLDTAERAAFAAPGQKPRSASDLKPIDAELEKVLAIPPAFDRVVPEEKQRIRTPEEIEADLKRKRLEKVIACVPPKPRALLLSGRFDALADPSTRDDTLRTMPQAVVLACDWFYARRHRVLILRGGVGTGKSTAAAVALYLAVLQGARSTSFQRPRQFISSMLHAYQADVTEVGKHFAVIDDMGEENRDDFKEALSTFLDEYDTPAVLTTNLTTQVFTERYQGRVFDRLRECAAWLPVKGESMRTGGGGFEFGPQQALDLVGQARR